MSELSADSQELVAPAPASKLEPESERKVRRGDKQTQFLNQAVILEEAGSSGVIRMMMLAIGLAIAGFLGWSAVTDVDEVAVTTGEVVPTGQVQSIQHFEGGIAAEILVHDGQVVKQGEVLIRLDPDDATVELKQMRAQRVGLQIQAARLRALGTGTELDYSFVGPEYQNLVEDQIAVYGSQLEAGVNRRKVIVAQLAQREEEIQLFKKQEETLLRNAELLLQELNLQEDLYRQGLTTKVTVIGLRREVNQARGDIVKNQDEIARAEEAVAESRLQLEQLETNAREQALGQMGTVTNELAQVSEAIKKLSSRVTRLEINAPVDGIVKGLKVFTIGGVIPPGAVLMDIVPINSELVVESRINTRDVGHVRAGMPVTVKVSAFEFARVGGVEGTLTSVSPSTFLDEKGDPYYKGLINLDRGYVGVDPEQNRILPGMTVEADIRTGSKTLLQYLLKPVVSSVKR